jgi:probable HAF family extracellular repeat protein
MVVGMALCDEPPVAPYEIGVRWGNGVLTPLAIWPSDVNGAGAVVGSEGYQVAAPWQGGTLARLGTLADPDSEPRPRVSGALGINDGGVVVGWSETVDFTTRAFVWQAGVMTELPTLGGNAFAADVNARGQIVGWSVAPDGKAHAVLWENGTITDLGALGGDEGYANGINDHGDVVGGAKTAGGAYHAALWRGGTVTDLGTLPGYAASHAYRINEVGVIVGYSGFPKVLRATVWMPR